MLGMISTLPSHWSAKSAGLLYMTMVSPPSNVTREARTTQQSSFEVLDARTFLVDDFQQGVLLLYGPYLGTLRPSACRLGRSARGLLLRRFS